MQDSNFVSKNIEVILNMCNEKLQKKGELLPHPNWVENTVIADLLNEKIIVIHNGNNVQHTKQQCIILEFDIQSARTRSTEDIGIENNPLFKTEFHSPISRLFTLVDNFDSLQLTMSLRYSNLVRDKSKIYVLLKNDDPGYLAVGNENHKELSFLI